LTVTKGLIDDSDIVEMYKKGFSQNDISEIYGLPVIKIRAVLKAAGFETKDFRALNDEISRIIILLINNGAQFKDIEYVCDVSHYAVREVVASNGLKRVSKKARYSLPPFEPNTSFNGIDYFIESYMNGKSFCYLCNEMKLSDNEILSLYFILVKENLDKHKEALKQLIINDSAYPFSNTALGKKHYISMAIVRKILRESAS